MGSATFTTHASRSVIELRNTSLFYPFPDQCKSWSKLRLTVFGQFDWDYTNDANRPEIWGSRFFVGLSCGKKGFNDDSPAHCLGVWGTGSALASPSTWSRYTTSGHPYVYQGYFWTAKKVGSTVTTGTASQNTIAMMPTDESATTLQVIALDFIKSGATTYVCTTGRTAAGASRASSNGYYEVAMLPFDSTEIHGLPFESLAWAVKDAESGIAVDEATDGVFDHVHISWSHQAYPYYLAGVGIRKYS